MRTQIEELETAEVHNLFKTAWDVLFIFIPGGFTNDKLAISDC